MEAWVRKKVERLGLDADVYVEYGRGILEDEDTDVAERVESVIGIFSGAADGLASDEVLAQELDAAAMVADVERILHESKQQQAQEEDLKRAEAELRDLKLREQEKKAAEAAMEKEREKAAARQKMSREELAAREKLISEYGFSVISEFDEEGNLVKTNDKEKESANLEAAGQNTNKSRVQQAQNAMREKMKKEHEKKVTREKELLEKDRLRKEKAKKKTVKREKQRGAG
uniref:CCDC43 PWI-like domain-containing protein n=1 Tax=Globisporangium ultimum (strain ATCC 200006 / CBS 805.95 / DAOM BR144) TaxID=431595 RepID=K3WJ53_GLOUD